MNKIIVDALHDIRVALIDSKGEIENLESEYIGKNKIKGNIYIAKVTRVEASLQAAFIDYGGEKQGFLPFSQIHECYYYSATNTNFRKIPEIPILSVPVLKQDDFSNERSVVFEEEENFDIAVDENETEIITDIIEDNCTKTSQQRIQDVIKKGHLILVQAEKEERGNKGATFTTYISIAGKYCVLMPNTSRNSGISRRISSSEERRRLKEIITKLLDESGVSSMIIRTAGLNRSGMEIKRDYEYLIRLWNKIVNVTKKAKVPCFIHTEDGIIQKTIRDMFDHETDQLIIQGKESYQLAIDFVRSLMPECMEKVIEYSNIKPIFSYYNLEDKIASLYHSVVQLPSGGYIVINPTEALISIDVNSGKSNTESNIEETALKTNIEASEAIARNLRLRNLAGIVVIDFIDMNDAKNRKLVEKTLKSFLKKDKSRIQMGAISNLGLLELSRQRLGSSFTEINTVMCSSCQGKGYIRSPEANASLIIRTLLTEISEGVCNMVKVYADQASILHILNYKKNIISEIEKDYSVQVEFIVETSGNKDAFAIEKIKQKDTSTKHQKPLLIGMGDILPESTNKKWTKRRVRNKKRKKTELVL